VWARPESAQPPLVLLPATGETAEDGDVVAALMSATRTVFAVNLRGHPSAHPPTRPTAHPPPPTPADAISPALSSSPDKERQPDEGRQPLGARRPFR